MNTIYIYNIYIYIYIYIYTLKGRYVVYIKPEYLLGHSWSNENDSLSLDSLNDLGLNKMAVTLPVSINLYATSL